MLGIQRQYCQSDGTNTEPVNWYRWQCETMGDSISSRLARGPTSSQSETIMPSWFAINMTWTPGWLPWGSHTSVCLPLSPSSPTPVCLFLIFTCNTVLSCCVYPERWGYHGRSSRAAYSCPGVLGHIPHGIAKLSSCRLSLIRLHATMPRPSLAWRQALRGADKGPNAAIDFYCAAAIASIFQGCLSLAYAHSGVIVIHLLRLTSLTLDTFLGDVLFWAHPYHGAP